MSRYTNCVLGFSKQLTRSYYLKRYLLCNYVTRVKLFSRLTSTDGSISCETLLSVSGMQCDKILSEKL